MHTSKFYFTNTNNKEIILILEPTGEEFILQENEKLMIVFEGDGDGIIEIEQNEDFIIFYGWSGCEINATRFL